MGSDPTGQRVPNGSDSVVPLGVGSGGAPPAPFPVDALPKKLQGFVLSVAKALPCPADYVGTLILPVLGSMIGRKRRVQIKPGWTEFPLIWAVIVGRSGDRKSPAFQKATAPLRAKQKKLAAQYGKELADWKSLPQKEQAETDRPKLQQVVVTDATLEALKDVLDASPTGVCYAVDEVVGWAKAMGQYKGGGGDDRQQWLSIWSSMQMVCNRKSIGSLIIDDPFVAVCGGIQPDILGDLFGGGREDGGAARILCSFPHPLPPADWTDEADDDCSEYQRVCDRLWALKSTNDPVLLSPEAKSVWVEWVNERRRQEPPDNLRPFWAKCEGYCLRLALILFLSKQACDETAAEEIDAASISGAVKLIGYFQSHAKRVYGTAADWGNEGRIGRTLKWVRQQGGRVTARKLRMNGVAGVKSAEEAEELLNDLAHHGHGTISKEPRGSTVFLLGLQGSTEPTEARN